MKVNFEVSKKHLYILSALLMLGLITFAFAYDSGGPPSVLGHSSDELEEADPTVLTSVKDGVDWTELSGIPPGFADDIDNESTGGVTSWNDLDDIPSGFADNIDNIGGGCDTFTYYKEEYIWDGYGTYTNCPQSDWNCLNEWCIDRGFYGRGWAGDWWWPGNQDVWFFSFSCRDWPVVTVCT